MISQENGKNMMKATKATFVLIFFACSCALTCNATNVKWTPNQDDKFKDTGKISHACKTAMDPFIVKDNASIHVLSSNSMAKLMTNCNFTPSRCR